MRSLESGDTLDRAYVSTFVDIFPGHESIQVNTIRYTALD